jgi:membrane-anchored protein YejM (alkaline phosphatase superfamily)
MGAWISYGLGTVNKNLPSFMVLAPHLPYAGTQVYGNDFLPAYHQGTRVVPGADPIPHLAKRTTTKNVQELELELAHTLNRTHLATNDNASELAARMQSFETAFRMQTEAPEAFDLSKETTKTLDLYGLKPGQTEGFGWQCLIARRLAERGVRFIELIDSGASNNWDAHADMKQHEPLAKKIDRPIAGLLTDLKHRGMLDETLVVWTTEFGRTPGQDGTYGRGHHSACFASWLAGGGVKGGISYGATDDIAATVAEDKVHVHDFHATLLHLLGIDHTKLTYRHGGRDYRLTDVHGNVVTKILASMATQP